MKKILIYPASFLPHKNHKLLLSQKVIKYLIEENFQIILTINSKFKKQYWQECFKCIGTVSKKIVIKEILNSNAVLFLSSFESLGIPLIEAAKFKKSIICPKLEYAKELLGKSPYYFNLKNFDDTFVEILRKFSEDLKNNKNPKASLLKNPIKHEEIWRIFLKELNIL